MVMEMMDEALEEANLILSSIELITIKKWFVTGGYFCFFFGKCDQNG